MKKRKWIKTDNMGNLYIENILITFDIPLLFVCDNLIQKFLVLCIDEEVEEYLVSPIDDSDLILMMKDQITMRDAFLLDSNKNRYILKINETGDCFKERKINIQDLNDELLPDDGAFYKVHNSKNDNYIKELENESSKNKISVNYSVGQKMESKKKKIENKFQWNQKEKISLKTSEEKFPLKFKKFTITAA